MATTRKKKLTTEDRLRIQVAATIATGLGAQGPLGGSHFDGLAEQALDHADRLIYLATTRKRPKRPKVTAARRKGE